MTTRGFREAATNLKSKFNQAYQSYKISYSSTSDDDDDDDDDTRSNMNSLSESESLPHRSNHQKSHRNHNRNTKSQNRHRSSTTSSGSSPRESSPPRNSNRNHSSHPHDNNKASKMVEQVMQTLFGACAGATHCPTNTTSQDDEDDVEGGGGGNDHDLRHVVHQIQDKSRHRHMSSRSDFHAPSFRNGSSTPKQQQQQQQHAASAAAPTNTHTHSETYTRAINTLSNVINRNGTNNNTRRDESYYAQQYKEKDGDVVNHYALAAMTDIQRQRDEMTQKRWQKKRMEDLKRDATQEASQKVVQVQSQSQRFSTSTTTPQKKKQSGSSQIQVDGKPYRLQVSEVHSSNSHYHHNHHTNNNNNNNNNSANSKREDEDESQSYNYDDGISALSAHTLEEMAKAEKRLDQIRGIPTEEGFDITCTLRPEGEVDVDVEEDAVGIVGVEETLLSKEGGDGDCDGPPSPVGTEESSTSSRSTDSRSTAESKSTTSASSRKEDRSGIPKTHAYPVQQARPSSPSGLSQTTTSVFSSEWDNSQEQQYWSQIIEEKEPPVEDDINRKVRFLFRNPDLYHDVSF